MRPPLNAGENSRTAAPWTPSVAVGRREWCDHSTTVCVGVNRPSAGPLCANTLIYKELPLMRGLPRLQRVAGVLARMRRVRQ